MPKKDPCNSNLSKFNLSGKGKMLVENLCSSKIRLVLKRCWLASKQRLSLLRLLNFSVLRCLGHTHSEEKYLKFNGTKCNAVYFFYFWLFFEYLRSRYRSRVEVLSKSRIDVFSREVLNNLGFFEYSSNIKLWVKSVGSFDLTKTNKNILKKLNRIYLLVLDHLQFRRSPEKSRCRCR